MDDAVRRGLDIAADAPERDKTIEITTIGARTGRPRRIEIWFHHVDGRWFITGSPPRPRDWYANLKGHPQFVLHLRRGGRVDVPAIARPIEDIDERRRVIPDIVAGLPRWTRADAEQWIAGCSIVEFTVREAGDVPGPV